LDATTRHRQVYQSRRRPSSVSRTRRFALSLAAFAVAIVATPTVAFLVVADATLPRLTAAVGGSLLAGGAGYALGTDDTAARVGRSRLGLGLVWAPVALAVALLAAVLLGGESHGRVVAVAAVGVGTAFFGGAFAWGAAASEHAARATAGESPVVTWEARPPETWWRKPRLVGGVGVAAVVASFALSVTVVPEASSLTTLLGGLTGGLVGTAASARRPRAFAAYRNGVSVESNGTVAFYEWDRIAAVDRTADAVVLRRRRTLPWSRLDARADAVDDADELAAALRAVRD
jgi:hypothetical protein